MSDHHDIDPDDAIHLAERYGEPIPGAQTPAYRPGYFEPDPDCWACLGTGVVQFGPQVPGDAPCFCVQHEAGECEPNDDTGCGCSLECKARAALRDGDTELADDYYAKIEAAKAARP